MFCPMCGAPNEEEAIFCGNCGAALTPEALEEPAEEVAAEAADEAASDEVVTEFEELDLSDFDDVEEFAVEAPPPPPPPPSPPSLPTSGLAIASLVMGIGGLFLLPLLGSILAVIFGYMARRDIRQRPDEISGDGLAMAGIVTGWIGVGLAVLGLVIAGGVFGCGLCAAASTGNFQ